MALLPSVNPFFLGFGMSAVMCARSSDLAKSYDDHDGGGDGGGGGSPLVSAVTEVSGGGGTSLAPDVDVRRKDPKRVSGTRCPRSEVSAATSLRATWRAFGGPSGTSG